MKLSRRSNPGLKLFVSGADKEYRDYVFALFFGAKKRRIQMDSVQRSLGAAVMQATMNFQGNMAAAVINGSLGNGANGQDQSAQAARASGMAAEGLGVKLNISA
jgi:hypothetical protein